jgi:hypothetical protein
MLVFIELNTEEYHKFNSIIVLVLSVYIQKLFTLSLFLLHSVCYLMFHKYGSGLSSYKFPLTRHKIKYKPRCSPIPCSPHIVTVYWDREIEILYNRNLLWQILMGVKWGWRYIGTELYVISQGHLLLQFTGLRQRENFPKFSSKLNNLH